MRQATSRSTGGRFELGASEGRWAFVFDNEKWAHPVEVPPFRMARTAVTATDFGPYPGFVADPYKDYSQPWFGDHKVLRGGCWATRFHMLRNTWRNFYKPDRRDVWAGFRTCAVR